MHPVLNFSFFEISSYMFFTVTAFIVVVVGSYLFARKRGFGLRDSLWMILGMGLSVFIGARFFNVLVNLDWYLEDFSRVFVLNTQGFSLYGGCIMGVLVGGIISYVRKIHILKFADTVIPFVGLGIACMRIGCFLNGCCFGFHTNLPWGVTFPTMSPSHLHQISDNPLLALSARAVHPTQLYELVFALMVACISFYCIRKKMQHGSGILIFVILFTAFRWFNMYLRVLPYSTEMIEVFYPMLYLFLIVFCVVFLVLLYWPKQLSIGINLGILSEECNDESKDR